MRLSSGVREQGGMGAGEQGGLGACCRLSLSKPGRRVLVRSNEHRSG